MATTTFRHQLIFYFVCGGLSTSCDFLIYKLLLHTHIEMDIAKATSFLIATFISYFLNKYVTFKTYNKSFAEFLNFIIVHVISVGVDVGANRLFFVLLGLFIEAKYKVNLSFILATTCSVLVNFSGQKLWVFKRDK